MCLPVPTGQIGPPADRASANAATAVPCSAPLHPGIRAALAALSGFALLAVTNAIAIAASIPWPAAGLRARLLHHLFDAASVLGLGLVAAAAIGAGTAVVERDGARSTPRARQWRRVAGLLCYAALAAAIMNDILGRDLRRQACVIFGGRFEQPLLVLYVGLCGLAVPAAHVLGTALSPHRRLRLAALALALGGILTNHLILRDDYHGLHGAIAWAAATLAGAAVAPVVEALARRMRPWTARGAGAGLAIAGVLGLAVPPSNMVRLELFREPCAIGAWVLAATVWASPGERGAPALPAGVAASPWWQDRAGIAPVEPTVPPLLTGKSPIVVLLTVDAVRADAIANPANERNLPAIAKLKRTSAYFTHAVSPGSQTSVSLATLFSGQYFSQLVWDLHGHGPMRFPYPAGDPARRFPEILTERGVVTASFCSINFLTGEYGVARGFVEEDVIAVGRQHAPAASVLRPLIARLRRAGDQPLFAFAHLTEPHAPYDRGGRKGTARERYLAEIRVADAQIAGLVQLLAERFQDRAYLIVTSDHGEAFGEHGTHEHTKTIYEELLRVPLIIQGPGIMPRRVDQRVGLIDLGPTILDLFGVETPGVFMGQSLVPLLAGRDALLDRPLLAEGRLRRALYWGDLKVIDDPRRKVVEAFDLGRDPGEELNLFDERGGRADPALAALRAFFAVHRAGRPGYEPMYKP